jgi:predicted aspartyl protease
MELMRRLGASLALLMADPSEAGAQPVLLQSAGEDSELILGAADAHERLTVPVTVQGAGPFRFLIDTGSQQTIVSTVLARQLALAQGPAVKIVGMAGVNHVATARVEEITFGKQSVKRLTVPLLDRQHVGADGILGTDALQGQRVAIDFVNDRISIGSPREDGAASGYEIVVRARRRSGRLILTNALIDGVHADVVIDTGAQAAIGNRALQQAMRGKKAGVGALESVTGHVLTADFEIAQELKLSSLRLSNVLIAFADSPAFAALKLAQRPAIFLGMREMRAFKRVAIDFASRKVSFDVPGR